MACSMAMEISSLCLVLVGVLLWLRSVQEWESIIALWLLCMCLDESTLKCYSLF